jgi:hypothetical protein
LKGDVIHMSRVFQFPDPYQLKRVAWVNQKRVFATRSWTRKLLQLAIKFGIKSFLKFIATFTQGANEWCCSKLLGFCNSFECLVCACASVWKEQHCVNSRAAVGLSSHQFSFLLRALCLMRLFILFNREQTKFVRL